MNEVRWDWYFLGMALYCLCASKDPRRKVGAVIVGPDHEVLSTGYNGLPRGVADLNSRLEERETKLKLIVHAEMNACLAAARNGVRLKGSTLYVVGKNAAGVIWGGPPCTRCTVELIQAGIQRVVSVPELPGNRWVEDLATARSLLSEAGVQYDEVEHHYKGDLS